MSDQTEKIYQQKKEEALEHLTSIRHYLVDKKIFFPYNYNATFVWSLIAVILTLNMVTFYAMGIGKGSAVISMLITVGFIAEAVMTKKVNRSYDIEDCTVRQRFIMQNFVMISFFLIVVSAVLAQYALYVPIYLMWLFLISLGYYAVGYVLNIRPFSHMARFNMLLAIVLLLLASLKGHLKGVESSCFLIVQAAVILGLSILPAIIAWHQKKGL